MVRRELYQEKNKIKDACKHFKFKKGGEKVYFEKVSKVRKIRIKLNDSKSNHGPWEYQLTETTVCFKKFKSRYGGTIKQGRSKSIVPRGKSKYSVFKDGRLVCYRKQKVEKVLSPSLQVASSQFFPSINRRVSL